MEERHDRTVLCMPGWKKGRDQSDNVIQCHVCQVWTHYECIDEDEADIVGIWTCNQCRKMPDDAYTIDRHGRRPARLYVRIA